MPETDWSKVKYFKPEEFDSPDLPGSGGEFMRSEFITALDIMRGIVSHPFRVNSGYRTEEHNRSVGGVDSSAHVRGWAADIACKDNILRSKILFACKAVGITRIGIADTFIHVDMDPSLPPERVWLYA